MKQCESENHLVYVRYVAFCMWFFLGRHRLGYYNSRHLPGEP